MHTRDRFRFKSLYDFTAAAKNMGLILPVSEKIDVLTQSLEIGGKELPNRIAVQPMEGCDSTADGKPGELTYRRYRRFALGGAGLLWFEATAVVHEGRANPGQLLISGNNLKDMKNLLENSLREARKKFGDGWNPYTVLQLTHSGRYSKPESEPKPVIAVKNPYLENSFTAAARLITDDELDELIDRYVEAAVMAYEIGFDAVDIKSCHGYLSSELLSAHTREGRYGSSLENRTRFLLDIVDRIKTKTGGEPAITARLSAYDGIPYPYGWGVDREDYRRCDTTEPVRLVKLLSEKGIRLVNISAGNPYHNPHISRPYDTGPYEPSEHPLISVARIVNLCREIQQAVPEIAVMAAGLSWLREYGANVAAGGIHDGWFALAGFGRQFIAYPDFPVEIMTKGRMERKRCCITCGKCSEIMRLGGQTGCVVHDAEVYLPVYKRVRGKKTFTRQSEEL